MYTDRPIAHDIQNVLIIREMKSEFSKYYKKRHNIPKAMMNTVYWEVNKLALIAKHECQAALSLFCLSIVMLMFVTSIPYDSCGKHL